MHNHKKNPRIAERVYDLSFSALLNENRYPKESRRYRRSAFIRTGILATKQGFQFLLQRGCFAIGGGCFKSVHRWTVVVLKMAYKFGWGVRRSKGKRIPNEADVFFGYASLHKAFRNFVFDTPQHRTDKTFGRCWRIRRTNF